MGKGRMITCVECHENNVENAGHNTCYKCTRSAERAVKHDPEAARERDAKKAEQIHQKAWQKIDKTVFELRRLRKVLVEYGEISGILTEDEVTAFINETILAKAGDVIAHPEKVTVSDPNDEIFPNQRKNLRS
jgi:hypothetical protein